MMNCKCPSPEPFCPVCCDIIKEKVPFGSLSIGDRFSVSQNSSLYVNVKVAPSIKIGCEHFGPFNVIDLSNGKPRTFHDNEMIFKLDNNS